MYDYTACRLEEITVSKSEKVEVLDDSRNWWLVKNRMGLQGYMPANLLQVLTHNQSRLDRQGEYISHDRLGSVCMYIFMYILYICSIAYEGLKDEVNYM